MAVVGKYILTLSHEPIADSLHVYQNGCLVDRTKYSFLSPTEIKTGAGMQVQVSDRLEARYSYLPTGPEESGSGGSNGGSDGPGPGAGGGTPMPLRPPTQVEEFAQLAPIGAGVCTYANGTIWGGSGYAGGPFGFDGLFNNGLTGYSPNQADINIRGVTFGISGNQTFEWQDRNNGYIGYVVAVWLHPPSGCFVSNDVVSGGLGGHRDYINGQYVYYWSTNTAFKPMGSQMASPAHNPDDYLLVAIYMAGSRSQPHAFFGGMP